MDVVGCVAANGVAAAHNHFAARRESEDCEAIQGGMSQERGAGTGRKWGGRNRRGGGPAHRIVFTGNL